MMSFEALLMTSVLNFVQGSREKEFAGEKKNSSSEFEPALIIRQSIKQGIIK